MSSDSGFSSFTDSYRIHKKFMNKNVRKELEEQCAPIGSNGVKWTKEIIVWISDTCVRFVDNNMKLILEINQGDDHGFYATHAYIVLLCEHHAVKF